MFSLSTIVYTQEPDFRSSLLHLVSGEPYRVLLVYVSARQTLLLPIDKINNFIVKFQLKLNISLIRQLAFSIISAFGLVFFLYILTGSIDSDSLVSDVISTNYFY